MIQVWRQYFPYKRGILTLKNQLLAIYQSIHLNYLSKITLWNLSPLSLWWTKIQSLPDTFNIFYFSLSVILNSFWHISSVFFTRAHLHSLSLSLSHSHSHSFSLSISLSLSFFERLICPSVPITNYRTIPFSRRPLINSFRNQFYIEQASKLVIFLLYAFLQSFLPVLGPLTWWCASTLDAALLM